MVLAPLCLIVFSLLHDSFDGSMRHRLREADLDAWLAHLTAIQTRWLAVHAAGLGLFPLLGLTVWWMLPSRGILVWISQAALALYMVLYTALDAVVGLGSYILVRHRGEVAAADRPGVDSAFTALFFDSSVTDWLGRAASDAWGVGVIAAAVAVWRTGGWRVALPLLIAGIAMSVSHFPPYGAIAGAALGLAVWMWRLQNTETARSEKSELRMMN
jgi:hypothetical protein